MARNQINFSIQEAGCLLYVADLNFGGTNVNEFHKFFGGVPGLPDLIRKGAVIAGSLYQDDGYNVRVVFGEITDEEAREWTSKASWRLNIETGKMVVSGVCDENLGAYIGEWPVAEDGGDYELGTVVDVSPGEYSVSIYGYPPNDLASGWMRLEEPGYFRETFGKSDAFPFEKPLEYFKRTRPDEEPPEWIKEGWEDANFLDFVIQLTPSNGNERDPEFEEDGCIKWEYRKPEVCPVGIEIPS